MSKKKNKQDLIYKDIRDKTKDLKPIEYKFLIEYINNGGNAKQAAATVRGYDLTDKKEAQAAAVWGYTKLKKLKPTIKEEMEAQGLSDKELITTLKDGLEAVKYIRSQTGTELNKDPDFKTRHLYLDTAFKLKSKYPSAKFDINLNSKTGVIVVPDIANPELWQKMLELTRPFIENMRGSDD